MSIDIMEKWQIIRTLQSPKDLFLAILMCNVANVINFLFLLKHIGEIFEKIEAPKWGHKTYCNFTKRCWSCWRYWKCQCLGWRFKWWYGLSLSSRGITFKRDFMLSIPTTNKQPPTTTTQNCGINNVHNHIDGYSSQSTSQVLLLLYKIIYYNV